MIYDDKCKTDFTKEELKEIIDFFLEYKPVLDKDNPVDTPNLWGGDAFLCILSDYDLMDSQYNVHLKKSLKNMGNMMFISYLLKN